MTKAISGIAAVAPGFDCFIVDQFGVLHDGTAAYPGARECLRRLVEHGKKVVLLSNSGRRTSDNVRRLRGMGFDVDSLLGIVTSGEVAWHALAGRDDAFHADLGRRCLVIAENGDRDFVSGLDLDVVDTVDDAEFVLVVGIDTPRRTMADYEPLLTQARARGLPLLCANNDLIRLTPHGFQPAPGRLAVRYQELGGRVRRYGKPDASMFQACLAIAEARDPRRVVMIGDSLTHDIAGAARLQLGTVYIQGGIGRAGGGDNQVESDGSAAITPDYACEMFVW